MKPRRALAIDVGTNTLTASVIEQRGDVFTLLYDSPEYFTGLGSHMKNGAIYGKTIYQTAARAWGIINHEALAHWPYSVHIVATHAARVAHNRHALEHVFRSIGAEMKRHRLFGQLLSPSYDVLELEVISGEQEAELTALGALLDVADARVVIDVGGGSTEFALCRRSSAGLEVAHKLSVPIGAISVVASLEEALNRTGGRFDEGQPIFKAKLERLHETAQALPQWIRSAPWLCVGGSSSSIACVATQTDYADRDTLHLAVLSNEHSVNACKKIVGLTDDERAKLPSLAIERQRTSVGSALWLLALLNALSPEHLQISKYGLRTGVALRALGDEVRP